MPKTKSKSRKTSQVTHSIAHYLKAIRKLLNERGYARAVDVAEELDISRSAAHMGLKALKQKGMVIEDKRHFFTLPEEYNELAMRMEGNLRALETFFHDILGVPQKEAHDTACRMEHQLSADVSLRLLAFIKYLQTTPEGEGSLKTFIECRDEICTHPNQEDCALCAAYDVCPLEHFEPAMDETATKK